MKLYLAYGSVQDRNVFSVSYVPGTRPSLPQADRNRYSAALTFGQSARKHAAVVVSVPM